MMGSQWEYEPSNILIYEKEFHHYVVNSVAVKLFVSFFFFFF